MTTDLLEGRKDRNRERMLAIARFCAVILSVPAFGVGLIIALALHSVLLGAVAMVVVAGGVAAWMFAALRSFGPRYVTVVGAAEVGEDAQPRLHNLVEGLCVTSGVTKPTLCLVDTPSRNVATVITAGGETPQAAMIVTAGLLADLSRIELEGVIAQQLSHLRDGDAAVATFVAALVAIPLIGPVALPRVRAALDADTEAWADLAGVRLTRYPPGLASALETLAAGATTVPGVPPTSAHLWLADPLGEPEPVVPHPPLADRIAVLREL